MIPLNTLSLLVFRAVLFLQESLSIQKVHLFLVHQGDQDLLWFLPYQKGQEGLAHLVVQGVRSDPALPMDLSLQKDPRYTKNNKRYETVIWTQWWQDIPTKENDDKS